MALMTLARSGESSRPLGGTRRSTTTTIARLRDITMFACRTSPGAVPAFSSRSWSRIQVVGTQHLQHWRDVPTIRNDKRSRTRHLSERWINALIDVLIYPESAAPTRTSGAYLISQPP